METKLEQIAVKAVNQLPKSVVREIRTPRSVGTGGGRPPPVTRWARRNPRPYRDHLFGRTPCTISILSGLSGAPLAKQAHCVMVGGTRPTTRRVPNRRSPIDLASSPSPELPGSLSQHDVVPHMIT